MNVINENLPIEISDFGLEPFIININQAAIQNPYYRVALWTGNHMQLTLMSIPPGEDIGLESHNVDQYLRVEEGSGLASLGYSIDRLNLQQQVFPDDVIFVPAGAWHNLLNNSDIPLKISSIYSPPEHPYGTLQPTKADEMEEEFGL